MRFEVPLLEGQKTGWFFDQAANRRALTKYVRTGARVLDVFSYVGAWGLRAAASGASDVLCVDSSAPALELAGKNAEANGLQIRTRKGDAFDALEALAREGARFDVVIIDPPAFAKRKKDLPKALAAYKRLNQLAMQVLAPDGFLVSCSCSYHVSAEELQEAIAKAARGAGKHVQLLEVGGQAPDHPVHPAIAETRYLKAYFCRVTDGLKYGGAHHDHLSAHQSHRDFDRPGLRHRAAARALVRHHVPDRIRVGVVAGALPSAAARIDLDGLDIDDLIFYCAVGVIVGGRVGWCMFYGHDVIAENWLNVFHIWDGGMSFHGGCSVCSSPRSCSRAPSTSIPDVLDFVAPLAGHRPDGGASR